MVVALHKRPLRLSRHVICVSHPPTQFDQGQTGSSKDGKDAIRNKPLHWAYLACYSNWQ